MLKPDAAGWSVVLIGQWNTAIFSPKWVVAYLTTSQDVRIEVPISGSALPPRLHFDSLYLYLGEQRISVVPELADICVLDQVERVALKILEALPHTPMVALGVNFQFRDDAPEKEVLKIFDLKDNAAISDARFSVKATSVTRKLENTARPVNFTIAYDDADQAVFDFNFHTDVTSAEQAAAQLRSGLRSHHEQAMQLLTDAYGYNAKDATR